MSDLPAKTGVPDLIDTRLTNTIDFHIATTSFNTITDTYINYLALTKYYDSVKYEADPITAEANFWKGLAEGNLELKKFAKNPKAQRYLKRIEISIPQGDRLKTYESGEPVTKIDATGNLIAETVNGNTIPLTRDDTVSVDEQIAKVQNGFNIASEDTEGEFLAWWLDKYRKSHNKVKDVLKESLTIEESIFQEISESIGFLFSQHLYPSGRYMHYGDDDSDPTPFPYNSVIDDKLELDTRKNILGLSRRSEAIFKRNMQQVIRTPLIGTDAHNENLVTDHFHYKRLKQNQGEVTDMVTAILGGAFNVLGWLQTNKLSNKQKTVPMLFEVVVENSLQEVDQLMNKIQTLTKPFDNTILQG